MSTLPPHDPLSRREFLGHAAKGAGLAAAVPTVLSMPALARGRSLNDTLRVGVVGIGVRGKAHMRALGCAGPPKNNTIEHEKMPGVEIVAVCDTFTEALDEAAQRVRDGGIEPGRYSDYREMLAKEDLDLLCIAAPDHMHARMTIDAMRAGADVYVEKCMTNTADEALEVGRVMQETGRILQAGYQLRQDANHALAKRYIQRGYIGEVNQVELVLRRSGENAGWRKDIANGGGPPRDQVDWEQFLGVAPVREYDPHRYFEWRRFWDYSTGIAGDLLSHSLDEANFVLGLGVPHSAVCSGGIYHWRDGRETPDTYSAVFEYPDRNLQVTYSSAMHNSFPRQAALFFGTEGTLALSWTLEIFPDLNSTKYAKELEGGKAKHTKPIVSVSDKAAGRVLEAAPTELWLAGRGATLTTRNGQVEDTTRLHFENMIECMRERRQPDSSYESAFPSTIGSHMSTLAFREGRRVTWDPEAQKIV